MTFFSDLEAALRERENSHLRRELGQIPAGVFDLASNDYLGFSRHPRVVLAAQNAVARFGAGARASRLVSGNYALLETLENRLARLKNAEAALVFSSGFAANLGVLEAICDAKTAVFCHKRNHASLLDGCETAARRGAKIRYFADESKLENLLANSDSPRKIVVCDGVFSMDGDVLELPKTLELCERFDAILLLDDAHGTGTLGQNGGGICEHFGVKSGRIVHVGTLSKALGSQGGFVAGPRVLVDFLVNNARPFVYSTGLCPAAAGAALESLNLLESSPQILEKLRENTRFLAENLREKGFDARWQPTPILPVILRDEKAALEKSARLLRRGFWCRAIRYPTVARGAARLRIGVCASWSREELEAIVAAF